MKPAPPLPTPLKLYDPRQGVPALQLAPLSAEEFSRPQRSNYFTALWIRQGAGVAHADVVRAPFAAPVLAFFNPYQVLFLETAEPLEGLALRFHANFFCIETYHEAVGCNGVLFNEIYGAPVVAVSEAHRREIEEPLMAMAEELQASGLAQPEMLISYLKIFLIRATRLKIAGRETMPEQAASGRRALLERLAELIEQNYRSKRRPQDYAELLHLTPKALGKLVKAKWGRTLTEVIRDRLLKQAKWELLHTERGVKEIAWEAGFGDEFYFSRIFKRATGYAPSAFREFETAIRREGKSSMP
jgi:AraC-like DNA-binding protein